MKGFYRKIVVFTIPILLYCIVATVWMPSLISLKKGPNTKEQIVLSFNQASNQDYEMLILGNSRTYRAGQTHTFIFDDF